MPIAAFVAGATLLFASASAMAQAPVGDVKAGEGKASMCIGCHGIVGYQNSFPEIHKVPKISGQSAGYIVSACAAADWMGGTRVVVHTGALMKRTRQEALDILTEMAPTREMRIEQLAAQGAHQRAGLLVGNFGVNRHVVGRIRAA